MSRLRQPSRCKGKRRHVEQKKAVRSDDARLGSGERIALNGGAARHALVGVDRGRGFLARQRAHLFLHGGNARRAPDEQDASQLGSGDAGIIERHAHRPGRALHQIVGHALELAARKRHVDMKRAFGSLGDEGEVDLRRRHRRQLLLRALGGLGDALERLGVAPEVFAVKERNSSAICSTMRASKSSPPRWLSPDVAKTSITSPPISITDTSNVPPPRVVDHHLLGVHVVQTVCERGACRLVDDAQDVQAGDTTRILGRLALGIVEVGGNRDDRVNDLHAQESLGIAAQLTQDHRELWAVKLFPSTVVFHVDPIWRFTEEKRPLRD